MLARHDRRTSPIVILPPSVHLSRRLVGSLASAPALIAILALTWSAYHPGLSGAFLFDDLGSLPKLGATGPVDNWATFWRYITSGGADPTGRPLAMLSFLIDARNWPADPYPFKVTNVILHLVNGVLLAWVLWKLGRILTSSGRVHARACQARDATASLRASQSRYAMEGNAASASHPSRIDAKCCAIAALFGAGAWLLHPLLVSTTLYVVQREAMLPATFVLIGLLGWIASRLALARGHPKPALAGMIGAAWLCTLLATLSKGNGILLPLLLLLTEWIVLAPHLPATSPHTRRWLWRAVAVFLVLPTLLLAAYLLYALPGEIHNAPGVRGWTVGQRLLTEPRVLTDYFRLLFVPHAHSSGLFNDAFPVSTGWLHPVSTLPCTVLIMGLIGVGFALRKRHPAIALALLFYFAAQLLESGWIPLELYFEHRNYLPAMLLFWPIGLAVGRPGTLRFLRTAAAAAVLFVLAVLTLQRATLWGDAPRQARVWAAINPDSARAQTSAALYDLQSSRPRLAAARLRLALPKHPDDLQIPVNLVIAECKLGAVRPETLAAARTGVANDRVGGDVAFHWFGDALHLIGQNACKGLDYAALQEILDAAWRNPYWHAHAGLRANLLHLQGALELAQHEPQEALRDFNLALGQAPRAETALSQAATLASAGYPNLGLAHLDSFNTLPKSPAPGFGMPHIHAWVLQHQGYWRHEIAYLRSRLETAARAQSKTSSPP